MELDIETPRVYLPLLEPARYKGVYGGRGSGKSHFFAEMMIEAHIMGKTDSVCVREHQKSLQQSVKKLLESKIEALNAGAYFEVQDKRIYARNGGIIIFEGLHNHTAESIKSLEGFDRAWVEEAQTMSQRSLDILRPTIRKPHSELWFSWNPRYASDPVDTLLRSDTTPPGTITVQANYMDNPWFPGVLTNEMEYDRSRDIDKYGHVWLGQYQQNSEARVFKNWRVEECAPDNSSVIRQGADWGFSIDPSVLIRCWIEGKTLYVDYEAYMIGCEIDALPDLFMSVPQSEKWGLVADSARPETISYMRKHGYPKILPAIKGARSVEEGVEFLKSYNIVVHPRCTHLIDELSLYSYKLDPITAQVLPVLADKDNHCIAEGVLIACKRGDIPIEQVTLSDKVLTRAGYQRVLFSGVTDVNRAVLRVETTNGVVYCTPDHEICTTKGFMRADSLRYNDEVINLIGDISCESNKLSTTDNYTQDTPNILTGLREFITSAAMSTCIVRYGWTATVTYLMGITSITRTKIRAITIYLIWSVSRLKSTCLSINPVLSGLISATPISPIFGTLQRHGTPALKALKSIGRLARKLIKTLSLSLSRVVSAVRNLFQERLVILTGFALAHVRRNIAGIRGWITNNEHAHNAVVVSPPTNTLRRKLAAGHVLTVTEHGISSRVYDLTVANHPEFFANGVLVHNCIDALRYACEGVRRMKHTESRKIVAPPVKVAHWR